MERGGSLYVNSDEEDGYGSPDVKRRGASVDDFLRGSELGKQVSVDWGPRRPPLASVPWPLQGQGHGHPRPWGEEEAPGPVTALGRFGSFRCNGARAFVTSPGDGSRRLPHSPTALSWRLVMGAVLWAR